MATKADGTLKRLELRHIEGVTMGLNFECPHPNCTHDIYIPINKYREHNPGWDMQGEPPNMTISPSLAVRGGCMSHFWIRNGKAEFC